MNTRPLHVACLMLALGFAAPGASAQSRLDLGSVFGAAKSLVQSQSVATMSEEEEQLIGKEVVAASLGNYPPLKDSDLQRRLNQIGVWVALQSSRPDLPWRFAAVRSDTINAFAAPGGTILVTQGMLRHVANEAELACVLGHEIAHVTRRHHISVLQKSLLISAGASALSASTRSGDEYRKLLIGESKEIFTRGLDRSSEREADEDGVLLAARAGYDPAACLNFMQRLASLKADTGALAALYKTHPTAKERVVDVDAALGKLKGAAPGEGARPELTLNVAAGGGKK
ncbi:MAG: M48 family metalloprotease [Burkholderiaceae bacterium]|nr:M48 family metalloprotease [Sulfuritalea sp.]MCF8175278.1 M48 family metalloprotease [Burkholderiaceae bacterium]